MVAYTKPQHRKKEENDRPKCHLELATMIDIAHVSTDDMLMTSKSPLPYNQVLIA